MDALAAMHAPGFKAVWVNPDGQEEFDSCLQVAEKVMSGWPTFRFEDSPIEMIAEGSKVFCTMNAKDDNGMDVIFGHFWEADIETGKLVRGFFHDDSAALAAS